MDLQVAEGDNLLDIAQANDLEMEGMLGLLELCGYFVICGTLSLIFTSKQVLAVDPVPALLAI